MNKLTALLVESFREDDNVMGVVNYVIAVMKVNDAIIRAYAMEKTEVRQVEAVELQEMRKYDNGMVDNDFFIKNYAPIKATMAVDDIKFRTASFQLGYCEREKFEKKYAVSALSIILSRMDVFTMIAFLWKGPQFAEEFDIKLRSVNELSPEHQRYFEINGVL